MNEHIKGFIGVAAALGGAAATWMTAIDFAIRVGAGVAAIVASIAMTRYYNRKKD